MILPNETRLTGTYAFDRDRLVFTLSNGTVFAPAADGNGNFVYTITLDSGDSFELVLSSANVYSLKAKRAELIGIR